MIFLPKRENSLSFNSAVPIVVRLSIQGYTFSTKNNARFVDATTGRNRDRFEFELDWEKCPSSKTWNSEKGVRRKNQTHIFIFCFTWFSSNNVESLYFQLDLYRKPLLQCSNVVFSIVFFKTSKIKICIWFFPLALRVCLAFHTQTDFLDKPKCVERGITPTFQRAVTRLQTR